MGLELKDAQWAHLPLRSVVCEYLAAVVDFLKSESRLDSAQNHIQVCKPFDDAEFPFIEKLSKV